MIRTKFYCGEDGGLHMELAGHAGSAPKGRDLVCAGASMLAATLAAAVERMDAQGMLAAKPRVDMDSGRANIIAVPRADFFQEVLVVFWTVEVGLGILAKDFAENVVMEETLKVEKTRGAAEKMQLFSEDAAPAAENSGAAAAEMPEQAPADPRLQTMVDGHWRAVDGIYRRLAEQAQGLKQLYPDFDLAGEMKDPRFYGMLRCGADMDAAFFGLHRQQILPAAMEYAARVTREQLTAGMASPRPGENGLRGGGAVMVGSDVRHMTRQDYDRICRMVERGEHVSFG